MIDCQNSVIGSRNRQESETLSKQEGTVSLFDLVKKWLHPRRNFTGSYLACDISHVVASLDKVNKIFDSGSNVLDTLADFFEKPVDVPSPRRSM